ncbi:MAG: B12-binding domain-containing protein [Planctomycetota bacterium]|nr:B12-binding domain-containing protein [Planctomycetota bacterium]
MTVFALLNRLTHSIIDGDAELAEKLTRRCLAESVSPSEILVAGLVPGMDAVLRHLRGGEPRIEDVLKATRAMEAALKILRSKPS